jgi:glycosyltransferase involved in cell wall biosynthesis
MSKHVFVGFKFAHMGEHAGYDLVRSHVQYRYHIDLQRSVSLMSPLINGKSVIARAYRRIFGVRFWWAEIICILHALVCRQCVFHFAYGENTYRYLWLLRRALGFRIVCTYHQPVSRLKELVGHGFGREDAVIILSAESREELAARGFRHAHDIPHGVDTDFFVLPFGVQERSQLLIVGNWLRDFVLADEVCHRILELRPTLEVHVVTLAKNNRFFRAHSRLHIHNGISDAELLGRYHAAKVLYLPLTAYVANNAVLEMAATGGQVCISSPQRSCGELEDFVEFLPVDIEESVRTLSKALDRKDEYELQRARVISRFSWARIGEQTQYVLTRISI